MCPKYLRKEILVLPEVRRCKGPWQSTHCSRDLPWPTTPVLQKGAGQNDSQFAEAICWPGFLHAGQVTPWNRSCCSTASEGDTAETVPGRSGTRWPQAKAVAFQTHRTGQHFVSRPLGFGCGKVSGVPVQENRLDPKSWILQISWSWSNMFKICQRKLCKTYACKKNSLKYEGFFSGVFKPI